MRGLLRITQWSSDLCSCLTAKITRAWPSDGLANLTRVPSLMTFWNSTDTYRSYRGGGSPEILWRIKKVGDEWINVHVSK